MTTTPSCEWCDGVCAGADLGPLLHPDLAWLWAQLAAKGDRRDDPQLSAGRVQVRAPTSVAERSAAAGLVGGRTLRAGQQLTLDLTGLTQRVRVRGARLTPGAVAAHAAERRLATRSVTAAAKADAEQALGQHLDRSLAGLPRHVLERIDPDHVWARLVAARWVQRLLNRPDAAELIDRAGGVLAQLPAGDHRIDRRTLVPGDPHALDDGQPLSSLVLCLANASVRRTRTAWSALGVDGDDLVGGLLVLGVRPAGWTWPADAVVTLPPRELAGIQWAPPPTTGAWAFVTENPSVVAAAHQLAKAGLGPGVGGAVHLLCTVGTPSELETKSVGALAEAGWQVAVRADFDLAGLAHVRALLTGAPGAALWRMGRADYERSVPGAAEGLAVSADNTPWDPALAEAMTLSGAPAYEEDLLPDLLADLKGGRPGPPGRSAGDAG